MICYRDRTYCDAPCARTKCDRFVTPKVRAAANRDGLPLALNNFQETCDRFKPRAPESGAGAATGRQGDHG